MSSKKVICVYVPALDGLRGIAIIAVMLFHAWAQLLPGGYIGVDIFFVLSGFLITSVLIREYKQVGMINLKNFYIRRLLRLSPALLLLLLTFVIYSYIFLERVKITQNLTDSLIALFYLSNWARAFQIHPPDLLGHTWSLSIEEQFYILWPITLLRILSVCRSPMKAFSLVVLMALCAWLFRSYLASSGYSIERLYNGLDTRADALLIGCALGIALSSNILLNRQKIWLQILKLAVPISVLGLSLVMLKVDWRNWHLYYWLFFVVDVFAGVLILDIFMSPNSSVKCLLETKWLVWVGSISYGLYLWHYPIYRTLQAMHYSSPVVLILGSIITFVVAICSYYFVERPVLRLKKNFQSNTVS